jgi:hypothetical protein
LESLYVKWPALPEIDEEAPEFDEWAEEYFHQEESTHQSNSLGFLWDFLKVVMEETASEMPVCVSLRVQHAGLEYRNDVRYLKYAG